MIKSNPYLPIEDYGVIGNLQTVALVGMNASIDMLSFPHFDSPSIFARLLDYKNGGYFQLIPDLKCYERKQIYFSDTNILLSRFLSSEGVAEVSDFMPMVFANDQDDHSETTSVHRIVRRAKCVRGEINFHMHCAPRFDYARLDHKVEKISPQEFLFHAQDRSSSSKRRGVAVEEGSAYGHEGLTLRLISQAKMEHRNGNIYSQFKLKAGESVYFVLENAEPGVPTLCHDPEFLSSKFKNTMNFWRNWIAHSTYKGRWKEVVDRSALVLKLLTSQRFGSMVAAPTFGLPEMIGGGRNWDYRYTWIRDSSFALYGLSRLGFYEEAQAFMQWIDDRCSDLPNFSHLQIMYGIDGRRKLTEKTLTHFEGYRGSKPVRIGNGAYGQLQLDIYGELMDSVYLYNKFGQPISQSLWSNLTHLINWVCKNWNQADEGIWEVRGGKHDLLSSRLMCWVAIDRGIRLALKRSFPAPLDRWLKTRDTIYKDIFKNFWDSNNKTFIQSYQTRGLDASALLMPMMKFISPTDPYWLSTLKAIETQLTEDSLVYRYRIEDGLHGKEGTFCMCSFWFIECMSRSGDILKARFLFDKMLGYANHLGLYAEELGPSGEHLGNFPQAFTHLALISAAYELDRKLNQRQSV